MASRFIVERELVRVKSDRILATKSMCLYEALVVHSYRGFWLIPFFMAISLRLHSELRAERTRTQSGIESSPNLCFMANVA